MQLPDSSRGRRVVGVPRYQTIAPAPPIVAAPEQKQDFLDALRSIWRHRRLVLIFFGVAVIASLIVAYSLPTLYTAEAQVQVGIPEQPVLRTDVVLPTVGGPDSEIVENERLVIQSRELAKQVIDRLHLANNPEFNPALAQPGAFSAIPAFFAKTWDKILGHGETSPAKSEAAAKPNANLPPAPVAQPNAVASAASSAAADPLTADPGATAPGQAASAAPGIETAGAAPNFSMAIPAKDPEDPVIDVFLGHIDVMAMGRSQVLGIDADAGNPVLAAQIANALGEAYLQHQRSEKMQDNNRIESYLDARIADLRNAVEQSEKAAAEYRRENNLYNVPSASLSAQELSQTNTQLINAQTAKAEADSRLKEALSAHSGADAVPEVLSSPLIQSLKEQEAQAEKNVAQYAAIYGPSHPKLVDARAQAADIRRKINMETNRIIDGLRNEARTADARYAALESNFKNVELTTGGATEKSIHLEALERDAAVNRNLLDAMLSRAKETFGRGEIEQPDAKLISTAAPPSRPSFPPKTLILLLGSLGGLLLGSIAALLAENADRTFRRADQVEQTTGLPVITMIPQLRRGTQPVTQVLRAPISPYSDALRKIHIGLQLSEAAETPKVVMFSSATPTEGKSVAVASLGRLLARNGRRVLVVDCDWRSPTLHRYFNCSNQEGLASLLTSESEGMAGAIFNDPLSGLDVIPAGGWNPHTANALISDRMRLLLATAARSYDFVLIDTAPVLVASEVLALSRMVDKTVFILRWGHTKREVVLDALRQLADAEADVMGVVMTRVDPKGYREFSYSRLNYDYGRGALANAH